MVASSRASLIAAHLERWGFRSLERVLAPLLDTRGRSAGGHARRLAWTSMRRTAIGRRVLAIAGGGLAVFAVAGVAAGWLALHLLPV